MDIWIEGQEGLPADGLVSIRAGATRRQAPLSSLYTSPLKFPPVVEASFEPLKIDVLLPIASARLVLQPNESHYRIRFDGEGKTGLKCLGLGIHRPGAGVGMGNRPASALPVQLQDATAAAKDYLEEHGILRYVQGLLHAIMQVRPNDPYGFMIKQLTSVVRLAPEQAAPDAGTSPPAAVCPTAVQVTTVTSTGEVPRIVEKAMALSEQHAVAQPAGALLPTALPGAKVLPAEQVNDAPMPSSDAVQREHQLTSALPEQSAALMPPALSPQPPSGPPPCQGKRPSGPGRPAVVGSRAEALVEAHTEVSAAASAPASAVVVAKDLPCICGGVCTGLCGGNSACVSTPSRKDALDNAMTTPHKHALIQASLEMAAANGDLEKVLKAAKPGTDAVPLEHLGDESMRRLRACLEEAAESGQLDSTLGACSRSEAHASGPKEGRTCAERVRSVLGEAMLAGELQSALAEYAPPEQQRKLFVREMTRMPANGDDHMGEDGHDGWVAALESATTTATSSAPVAALASIEESKMGDISQGTAPRIDPTIAVEASCPQGHALIEFATSLPNFSCDGGCRRSMPVGSRMWSCRACNYDICDACCRDATGEKSSPPVPPPAHPPAVTPPIAAAPALEIPAESALKTGAALDELKERMRVMLEHAADTGELENTLVELTPKP